MTDLLKQKLDMILENDECKNYSNDNIAPNIQEKKTTDVSKYFLMICIILCIAYLLYRMKGEKTKDCQFKSKKMFTSEFDDDRETEIEQENELLEKNKDVFFQEF